MSRPCADAVGGNRTGTRRKDSAKDGAATLTWYVRVDRLACGWEAAGVNAETPGNSAPRQPGAGRLRAFAELADASAAAVRATARLVLSVAALVGAVEVLTRATGAS